MPNDNTVPPKPQRINVANVGQANVTGATFTRADIQTGEIKSAEGDILSEIRNAVTSQTDTLKGSFEQAINACCDRIVKAGGAGGAGGGGVGTSEKSEQTLQQILNAIRAQAGAAAAGGGDGGGGGTDIGAIASTRRMQSISRSIEDVGYQFDELGNVTEFNLLPELKEFHRQMRENVNETVRSFNAQLIKLLGSITRIENFTDEAMSRWTKGLDLASSGLADFNTMFLDDTLKLTGIWGSAGDSLMKTAETIRELSGEITSPMRLMQTGVEGVAGEFERLRDEAEDFGLDLYARVGFDEQNKLLMTMIDAQRRSTISNDMNNFEVRQRSMEQIKFLGILADNTGKSLEELVKSNAQTVKDFNELVLMKIITQKQADNFAAVAEAQPALKDYLLKIAESGGDWAAFARKNEDFADQMVMTNTQHLVPAISQLMRDSRDGVEANNAVHDITKEAFTGIGDKFSSVATSLMLQGTDIHKMAAATAEETRLREEAGKQSDLVRAWNKMGDIFTNTWPIQWAKSIGALGFNTMAILANTAVHWKSSGFLSGALGGFKNVIGKLGGLFKGGGIANTAKVAMAAPTVGAGTGGAMAGLGSAMGGIAKLAGGIGATAMVGKDVYDLATGDTSGANIGALVGSAIGGVLGFISPIPGGTALGVGLGNMAGQWIGEKMAGGPGTPKQPSMAPRGSVGAARPGGGNQMVAMHMSRQTELLGAISAKMDRSIAVQGDIASGINKIGLSSSGVGVSKGVSPAGKVEYFARSPSQP